LSCCAIAAVRSQRPCLGAPEHLPHSFAAASDSCDAYVICMGGNDIHGQRCPTGMNFEPITQTCGESSCMDCSPFGIQNLPYPADCYRYIRCTMGTREFDECPAPLMFDRSIANCNRPDLVDCPYNTPIPTEWPTETTPEWPTDTTPEWPTDTTWTPDPWPPTTTEPPGGDRPVCRGQVFHAHPTNCTRFFICMDEVLWESECPEGLYWNQLRNACDLPERAGCIARPPGETVPPTGIPPTDPPLSPPYPTETTLWDSADEQPATAKAEEEEEIKPEPESQPIITDNVE